MNKYNQATNKNTYERNDSASVNSIIISLTVFVKTPLKYILDIYILQFDAIILKVLK